MHPQVQLNIPQPCHENWQQMTPSQQGRFCTACAKEVVDFTSMSDTEVLHYFLDKKNEKVCGRMHPEQLNRSVTKPVYAVKKKWWHWNYAAMLLLLFGRPGAAKAQGVVKAVTSQLPAPETDVEARRILGKVTPVEKNKQLVHGKITDDAGTALAGATILIKGTQKATVSDTNGEYSITVNSDKAVLTISSVGFETTETDLKSKKQYDIVLTKLKPQFLGEVVVVGGVFSSDYIPAAVPKHIAVIEVLDNGTRQPVKAILSINKNSYYTSDNVNTDSKGVYKLKHIKEDDKYQVTVTAAGYKATTLDIKGWNFNNRKETRYVFLEREKTVEASVIRVGIVSSSINNGKDPLYVIDGVLQPANTCSNLNPDKIENIEIIKGGEASALFGAAGQSGAIIITTKKDKGVYKDLKPVNVTAYSTQKRSDVMGAVAIKGETINTISTKRTWADSLNLFKTKLTGSLKIFPSPVQKGNAFTISYSVKQTGNYLLQITNATGQLLQQQTVTLVQKTNSMQIQANAAWGSGMFYIKLSNEKNNLLSTNSFIVQ
jgi:TonB-dependent SusC/RagA subfamily outer membrane receptor